MSVARITEISVGSPTSFEDATRSGVDRANKTLRNVRGVWVKEQQVVVENEAIKKFRVNLMVTFILDD
jgi:flavin-binding protein dodecin